jgi:ABC-type lipoprotein release transport system permease subunit
VLELRLAWRNVWRNPRRTVITLAATVFAVVLVVTFVAMAAGSHEKMIEDSVRLHSGHLALSAPGYLEHRTLDYYVELEPELVELVEETEGIRGWAPRVLGFALLSKDTATQGVALLGVDPERESTVTTLVERVERGRFVARSPSREIVLGRRLARNLGAELGDEVLLYSAAYSMETAYDLFTVTGVVNLMEPTLDRSTALISLADAQEFFVYGDRVSEVAILAADADAAAPVAARLRPALAAREGAPIVHLWNELLPELEQFVILDDAGMYLLLVVLVVVVAFGILNTLLMSVLERSRELGVVLALGLRPAAVFRVVYWESMMIAGVGLVIGLALAIPLVLYFEAHPIPLTSEAAAGAMDMFGIEPVITWKLKPLNPIGSVVTILGVAALAALYPAWKASRARPVDALRAL